MWDLFEQQQFEFSGGELKWSCKCPKCGKKFDQRSKLMLHITTKHTSLRSPNGKLFQCQQCQVKFIHKQSLAKHVETHHSSGSSSEVYSFLFMCRECDDKFDCDYSLWCHMMLHALNKPVDNDLLKKYQCPKCPAKFLHKKDFKKHEKFFHKKIFHEKPQPRLVSCDICLQQFERKKDLKWHRANEHIYVSLVQTVENAREKAEKPYKCRKCQTRFCRKVYLKWHKNLHRRQPSARSRLLSPEKLFDLLKCGPKFDLQRHQRWHLTSDKEKMVRSQTERFTRDLSLVDNFGNRFRKLLSNIGSALASIVPKSLLMPKVHCKKMPIFGVDKPYRNTSPNWYAMV